MPASVSAVATPRVEVEQSMFCRIQPVGRLFSVITYVPNRTPLNDLVPVDRRLTEERRKVDHCRPEGVDDRRAVDLGLGLGGVERVGRPHWEPSHSRIVSVGSVEPEIRQLRWFSPQPVGVTQYGVASRLPTSDGATLGARL